MRRFLLVWSWVLAVGCTAEPHHLAVVFPEAAGLKPGDNVSIRGLAVGQVVDVDLHPDGVVARLEIAPRFRGHVDDAARFRLESERLVTGKMAVVVVPGEGAPLADGATVRGEGPPADPIAAAKAALVETVDHAAAETRGMGRDLLNPDQRPPRASGGTVDLDRPGAFRVRLVALRVEATRADGDDWDTASAPDPVVQVWVDRRQVLLTTGVEDRLAVEWAGDEAASASFALTGVETVRVKVLDADLSFNDEIGVVELRPTAADARAGRAFRLAAGRVAELRLVVEEAPVEAVAPAADQGVASE